MKKSGDLSLASHGKCGKGNKTIVIAKQGPTGAQGPVGANGTVASIQPEAARLVAAGVPNCAAQPGAFCNSGPPSYYCYAWGNSGSGFASAAFLKDAEGFVHLRGSVQNSTSGGAGCETTPIFYLPAGYRVSGGTQRFGVSDCSGNQAYVDVSSSGGVYYAGPSICVSLSGIEFHADA